MAATVAPDDLARSGRKLTFTSRACAGVAAGAMMVLHQVAVRFVEPGRSIVHVSGILSAKGHEVTTVTPEAPVADAVALLRDQKLGALVVSADGRHIDGILSERDVVRRLADVGTDVLTLAVSELMTSTVRTCKATDTIDSLMAPMTEHRIRHLPVVDDEGLLAGIVSIGDVVKHRMQELENDQQQLIEYVRSGR
jgi:CBS domain-containing protein